MVIQLRTVARNNVVVQRKGEQRIWQLSEVQLQQARDDVRVVFIAEFDVLALVDQLFQLLDLIRIAGQSENSFGLQSYNK